MDAHIALAMVEFTHMEEEELKKASGKTKEKLLNMLLRTTMDIT